MPTSDLSTQAIPFPCVVYRRERPGGVYRFSHACPCSCFHKTFPSSLRVADLRSHQPSLNLSNLHSACFLVLVAGDVAQAISVSTHSETRTSFLYTGSTYDRQLSAFSSPSLLHTEFHESYVPLKFYGTMATFDYSNRFQSAVPIESGISLFPSQISEGDVTKLSKWVENAIQKAVHSSVWVTSGGQTYNEYTLRLITKQL
jgi:hypothetical protein